MSYNQNNFNYYLRYNLVSLENGTVIVSCKNCNHIFESKLFGYTVKVKSEGYEYRNLRIKSNYCKNCSKNDRVIDNALNNRWVN